MWPFNPALVYNRAFDVLASNRIADAMFMQWTRSRNLMHTIFTDPEAQTFYCNWSVVAEDAVASFRHGFGLAPNDVRLRTVRDELLERSPAFAALWMRHDARRKALQNKTFRHPEVGVMALTMQTFDVRSSPGKSWSSTTQRPVPQCGVPVGALRVGSHRVKSPLSQHQQQKARVHLCPF